MRLYEINSPKYSGARSKPITLDQAKELFKNHSEILSKPPIFRGTTTLSDTSILYSVPSEFNRKSANTRNYATLMIDNFPNWKEYPKRSKSLICTTDTFTARAYGQQAYRVLPHNGGKIGICPNRDIWMSFKTLYRHGFYLNNFNEQLNEIVDTFTGHQLGGDNFNQLCNQLNHLDAFLKTPQGKIAFEELDEYTFPLISLLKNRNGKSLLEFFQELLDPNTNNFELKTTSTFQENENSEVWTDAPCLLIAVDKFDEILSELTS